MTTTWQSSAVPWRCALCAYSGTAPTPELASKRLQDHLALAHPGGVVRRPPRRGR